MAKLAYKKTSDIPKDAFCILHLVASFAMSVLDGLAGSWYNDSTIPFPLK